MTEEQYIEIIHARTEQVRLLTAALKYSLSHHDNLKDAYESLDRSLLIEEVLQERMKVKPRKSTVDSSPWFW